MIVPLLVVFRIEEIETPVVDPEIVMEFQNELLPLLKNTLIWFILQPFVSVQDTLKLEFEENKLPELILYEIAGLIKSTFPLIHSKSPWLPNRSTTEQPNSKETCAPEFEAGVRTELIFALNHVELSQVQLA